MLHLPDLVIAPEDAGREWSVDRNSGSSFDLASDFEGQGPLCIMSLKGSDDNLLKLGEILDMNGDGLPDRVRTDSNSSPFQVQLNHAGVLERPLVDRLGIGWGSWHASIFRVFAGSPGHPILDDDRGYRSHEIFDWNGDGFPDAVQADACTAERPRPLADLGSHRVAAVRRILLPGAGPRGPC